MDNIQVQTDQTANAQQAQSDMSTNVQLPPEAQQYVVTQDTNTPANPQGAQAQVQPEVATPAIDTNIQELQRKLNERQLEIYRLQQEKDSILQMQQRAVQQPQANNDHNPFDPQTQYEQWDNWRMDRIAKLVAQQTTENLLTTAQQQQQIQLESQWQMEHPQVNINQVKQYVAYKWGVNNPSVGMINDAYQLMVMPAQVNAIAQTQAQNFIQNNRQPQIGATPVRNAQSAGVQQVGLSWQKMAEDFDKTNGKVESTWSPELKKAFWEEAARRQSTR